MFNIVQHVTVSQMPQPGAILGRAHEARSLAMHIETQKPHLLTVAARKAAQHVVKQVSSEINLRLQETS